MCQLVTSIISWPLTLVLERQESLTRNDFLDRLPPTAESTAGYAPAVSNTIRAAKVGVIASLLFLCLGVLLSTLGGKKSYGLARFILTSGVAKKITETADMFLPIIHISGASRGKTSLQSESSSNSTAVKKTSVAGWINMTALQLRHEESRSNEKAHTDRVIEQSDISPLDIDVRGFERWELFRRQGEWVGACRLCGQEIQYHDAKLSVGEVDIKHRDDPIPDINFSTDLNLEGRTSAGNIRDSIVWQALDYHPRIVGKEYGLLIIHRREYPSKSYPSISRKRLMNPIAC